jgi:hypothetical protein
MQIFIATMEARQDLRPDVPLARSQQMQLAGRPLDVHITDKAVSDADLWFFDRATGVAVIGDLVTVPVPYFETACPAQWSKAMDEVWATPFERAIPGHGRPMARTEFDTYRKAFNAFMTCVDSDSPASQCAATWMDASGPLIVEDPARRKAVAGNAEYYVGYLRPNGGKAPDCLAK